MKNDPVLSYAKKLTKFIGKLGLKLRLPKDFSKTSEDNQRMWISNLQDIAQDKRMTVVAVLNLDYPYPSPANNYPEISQEIEEFLQGGPRPPITG
jgi:hypothetical protein